MPIFRRGRSRRGRLARIAGGLISLVLILALLVVAAAYAILTTGLFDPLRTRMVEAALGRWLGADVTIAGPVTVLPGRTVVIAGENIRVDDGSGGPPETIGTGEIRVELRPLLRGRLAITGIRLQDVALNEHSPLVVVVRQPDAPAGEGPQWFGIIPGLIRLAGHMDIAVTNVRYPYRDEGTGWVFDTVLSSFTNTRDVDGALTALAAEGTINGTPLRIEADVDRPAGGGTGRLAVTMTSTGITITAGSTLSDDPTPELGDITLAADVSSVGDVLDSFRIARTVEGTARGRAAVELTGGTIALRDIAAGFDFADGPRIDTTGDIADAIAGTGFDLAVTVELPPGVAEISEDDGLLAFAVYEIRARLGGDVRGLALTDGWIDTNLFSGAVPSLGPITAEAIRRDPEGRIAIDGLHVLAGPADNPTLDLSGTLGDLLRLSDYRLGGRIAVPVAQILLMPQEAPALGVLTGRFSISDEAGAAGIDTLEANVTGSDLISAEVRFRADQSEPPDDATLALSLTLPDYARFAEAAELPAEPAGRVAYSGTLTLGPDSGGIDGRLNIGQSEIVTDLSIAAEDRRPVIGGRVASQALALGDVRSLAGVGQSLATLRTRVAPSDADAAPAPHRSADDVASHPMRHPRIDVEISAARIDVAQGEDVSNVSGRLTYDDGMLGARSMQLNFRQGRFDFDGRMNLAEDHLPFSADGRLRSWPIQDALEQFSIDLPIRGTLNATFDVASSGTSVQAALSQADGTATLRLVDGVIGTRLIDLTGLVLPSWLTAPSAGTGMARIACLDADLAFDAGSARIGKLVVETDDVVVTAAGRIDFRADRIDIVAHPRALRPNLIPIVSPFEITGELSRPRVVLEGGVAGRVVAEALALPLNALGTLLGVDRAEGAEPPPSAC